MTVAKVKQMIAAAKAEKLSSVSLNDFLSHCVHSASQNFKLLVLNRIRDLRGVLLPGAPNPVYLINKLIKQQVQIYYLHL